MIDNQFKQLTGLERFSVKATRWVGSIQSLMVHTILFIASFVLVWLGVAFDKVLLVLTTIVSLEAIYLAIFIQMSVNRQSRRLYAVSKDIDEIQKDVEEIQEDVEGIEKDVDEIQKDVEEIQEDDETEQEHHSAEIDRYEHIQKILQNLAFEVSKLQKLESENKPK